jgi:hypothetical protein
MESGFFNAFFEESFFEVVFFDLTMVAKIVANSWVLWW